MFERFTDRARHVVVLAQDEAQALRHSHVGAEHLLLGLLREPQGLAAGVLERLGITAEDVRDEIVRHHIPGEGPVSGQVPFSPRSKKVLELALRESRALGHDYIGTEHVLLGLVGEGEGLAVRILIDARADPETIRDEVMRALAPASRGQARGVSVSVARPRPLLDWEQATMLWRPEGLELRVPLHLSDGALALFAADEAWMQEPLAGMRREIWRGWVALASPTLLEQVDPTQLRRLLDAAAHRAGDVRGQQQGRVEDFLRRLRERPSDQD